jgi:hypothetical protein
MLMSYKTGDTNGETVRVATLGALRFGKPLVVDNGDLPLDWATMASWFDCVRAGLWDMLCDGSMVKDANFMKLSKPEDGDNFKEVSISCCCQKRPSMCQKRPMIGEHLLLLSKET